jgi:hypothetical protein
LLDNNLEIKNNKNEKIEFISKEKLKEILT